MKTTHTNNKDVGARYHDVVAKVVNNNELSARDRVRQIYHLTNRFIPLSYLDGMTDKIVDLVLQCGPNTSASVLGQVRLVGILSHARHGLGDYNVCSARHIFIIHSS